MNKCQVLGDGVYVELISFIHPPSYYPPGSPERLGRENHYWARKHPGWIDFALLGNGSRKIRISEIINNRAKRDGSGTVYDPEEDGGRERPDGVILKWLVTNPQQELRGTLPFFCGDVTPRKLRVSGSSGAIYLASQIISQVPLEPSSNTKHPSTAHGIAHVRVLTSASSLDELTSQLTSVIGNIPHSLGENIVFWELETVRPGDTPPRLILQSPDQNDDEADQFVLQNVIGIYEVGFFVDKDKKAGKAKTPYGKIAWVPRGSV